MDNGNVTALAHLDLAANFDAIDHAGCLLKWINVGPGIIHLQQLSRFCSRLLHVYLSLYNTPLTVLQNQSGLKRHLSQL